MLTEQQKEDKNAIKFPSFTVDVVSQAQLPPSDVMRMRWRQMTLQALPAHDLEDLEAEQSSQTAAMR